MKEVINKFKEIYGKLPIQVKASLWFLICLIFQKGISIITTPIFTRLLSTSEYGRFSVFNSWENIITIFVSLNLSLGIYNQGLVKYEDDRLKFSSSLQGLTLTLLFFWSIIYYLFHTRINSILNIPTLYMILMLVTIWLNAIFQFWASEQKVEYKYRKLIIITLIFSICSPLLSIILIYFLEDNVLARILGVTIVSFVLYINMFISQMKRGKTFFSKFYWKKAITFNIPLIPHYLSQTVLNSSDRIMIERMVNSGSSGIYSLAYSLSLIMTIFNSALMQTISPWMYKKIKEKKIYEIETIAYSSLIIIALANVLLIVFAPEAVAIFAPKEYYEAVYVVPPVAMSVYFMYMYDLFAKFEFYYEKTKLISTATMFGAIINIILNYFCIKKFGFIAAGYTTLVCYVLYALFHYFAMTNVCNKHCNGIHPYNEKKIIITSILFILFGFISLILYKNILLRYIFIFVFIVMCIFKRNDIINYFKMLFLIKKKH